MSPAELPQEASQHLEALADYFVILVQAGIEELDIGYQLIVAHPEIHIHGIDPITTAGL